MNTLIGLLFIILAGFLAFFDQALLAALCFLAGVLILLARFLSKTAGGTKAVGGTLTKGMWQQFGEAKTSGFDSETGEEGLKNAADLAGQQLYAGSKTGQQHYSKDQYQFKFKGLGAVGEACQKLIDSFKKVFK